MSTPTVTGVGYTALQNRKRQLLRKAKEGSVFIAPPGADPIIETNFCDPTNYLLLPLPAGYRDLGLTNEDGVGFSSDIDTSDTTSWGFTSPTRTDIASESSDAAISFQETNRSTLALYTGVEPEAITAKNGVTAIYRPAQPIRGENRVLFIGVDYTAHGEIYVARSWPVATLTNKDDQNYQSGDDPIMWPVTLSARPDDALGTPEIHLFGGPGWVALLDEMGIEEE